MAMLDSLATFLTLAQSNAGGGGGAAAGIFAGGFFLVFLAIALAGTIFWIWMLVDCLTSALPSTEKLIWFLVIFLLHLLGAIIYFFVGRGNRGGGGTLAT